MQKLNDIQEHMSFKEEYERGTFSYTRLSKHKPVTHFHFLNNGYCSLATYYVPRVLGTYTHYFV